MATLPKPGVELIQAVSVVQVEQARQLILEYADSLGFSLDFQHFDDELKNLPGAYAPPSGRLLLAYSHLDPDPSVHGVRVWTRHEPELAAPVELGVRPKSMS